MSKTTRVSEEELAKTIGLDRSGDHPLSIGRNVQPRDAAAPPLLTPLGEGFSEAAPPEVRPQIAKAQVPEQQVASRRISSTAAAAAPVRRKEFVAPQPAVAQGRGGEAVAPKKAELYPRRIGIGMNDELKSELDSLTAQVQALRTVKSERHTTNTVVRCALKYVLENIQFYEGDTADTEEELAALFNQRLKRL